MFGVKTISVTAFVLLLYPVNLTGSEEVQTWFSNHNNDQICHCKLSEGTILQLSMIYKPCERKDLVQNVNLLNNTLENQLLMTYSPTYGTRSTVCDFAEVSVTNERRETEFKIICIWENRPRRSDIDCICATYPHGIIETKTESVCEVLPEKIDNVLDGTMTGDITNSPMGAVDNLDVTLLPLTGQVHVPHDRDNALDNPTTSTESSDKLNMTTDNIKTNYELKSYWTQLMSVFGLKQIYTQNTELERIIKEVKTELVEEITYNATNLTKTICPTNTTKMIQVLERLENEYDVLKAIIQGSFGFALTAFVSVVLTLLCILIIASICVCLPCIIRNRQKKLIELMLPFVMRYRSSLSRESVRGYEEDSVV